MIIGSIYVTAGAFVVGVPIGILTAIVGTPIFGFMFWKTQAKGWSHD